MGKTLFEKIWESHIVSEKQNEPSKLIFLLMKLKIIQKIKHTK